MLPQIPFGLRRVPFEAYFHAEMLLQFCTNIKADHFAAIHSNRVGFLSAGGGLLI
jgi:hypothetical protein